MMKMSMQVKPVKPRRINASLIANDNLKTQWSNLTWTEQANLERRLEDLEWQLNYANLKLHNWRDLENGNWTSLSDMRDNARKSIKDMLFG